MKTRQVIAIALLLALITSCSPNLRFTGGHSHNDYSRSRPLFDAWENDMVSIEADIYYRNGKILVGHDVEDLSADKTLERLYLDPLLKLTEDHQNSRRQIILLIDIKDNAEESYAALKRALVPYHSILTRFNNGKLQKEPVTVILSGNRPIETVRQENDRLVFIDGRINSKDLAESSLLTPLISDAWATHFTWQGAGEMPENELIKLQRIVKQCHDQNKMLRFWGLPTKSPQMEKVWEVLLVNDIDLIGSDCPSCLKDFLINFRAHHSPIQ